MIKRLFDIGMALLGLIILSPVLILIFFILILSSGFPVIYSQQRVGMHNRDFQLYKFRTMVRRADEHSLLTTGRSDQRITPVGRTLRKYKLDELPQLWNVLLGDMSLVGPRPEVRKYVNLYTPDQLVVLSVKPGLTDYASLAYFNENEILEKYPDPEAIYIEKIMPEKLKLNLQYIKEQSFGNDLRIIGKTIGRILS
ncbi:MAG: sugar transferase [Bacteroidetes bacterium]|nr:sugar transferase [Bacteroidota bacterium]